MTTPPVAGWYPDPQVDGRLRYWDGDGWTEHLAAPQPPAAPAYRPPLPPNVTLYSNPYQKPPRAQRRTREALLNNRERIQAAAIDAAIVLPFIVLGLGLPPLLQWLSGDGSAGHHAYLAAGVVLAVVIGGGVVAWNLLIRDITLGTQAMLSLKKKAP